MKAGFPFSSFMNLDLRYLLVDLMMFFGGLLLVFYTLIL